MILQVARAVKGRRCGEEATLKTCWEGMLFHFSPLPNTLKLRSCSRAGQIYSQAWLLVLAGRVHRMVDHERHPWA
jgi:hypothetical protein